MLIKKLIKIIVVLVVLVALTASAAMIMLTKMIKPEAFKEQLSKAVYSKTGRQLAISGNVGLSIFPWLGVRVMDISLSNAARFQAPSFATAGNIEVQIKALPLLFGKVEMGKLVFNDLTVNLTKKPSGITNWNDLVSDEAGAESGAASKSSQLSEIYISSVDVSNATIIFDDQQKKRKTMLKNVSLGSQKINLQGIPFLLKAAGTFENSAPDLVVNFNLNGEFVLDLHKKLYSAKGLGLLGEIGSSTLRDKVPFGVSADVVSDLSSQKINIDNLAFNLANMKASGTMQATDIIYAPNVVGSLEIGEFDPKPILRAIGMMKEAAVGANANNASPSIWQKAALKLSIQTTSRFVKIPKLEIKFNDSVLTGGGSYSHFSDKIVAFDLDLNQIDLDRYLPKQASQTAVSQQGGASSGLSRTVSSSSSSSNPLFIGLRQVLLNGAVHIGDLKFSNMNLSKVEMEIEGEKGKVNLKPISFDLYQGKARGDLDLDVRKAVPVMIASASFSNVAVKPLFKDLVDTDKLSGTGFLNAKISTKGETKNSLLKNLNGSGSLRISNGDFYGVDIGYQVERGRALIEGKPSQTQESKPPHTSFGQLTESFKITNGIFSTNNLLLLSKLVKVQGSGTADLANQTMNMLLQATYLAHGNFYVPIRVTGTFTSPSITPDVSVLIGNIIKDKVIKGVDVKGIKINDKNIDKTIKDLLHF